MGRTVEMIDARRNLALKMKSEGRSEDDVYTACKNLKYEPLLTEIRNAETAIEKYARFYHAKESECPDSFKFMMLFNGWKSPFVALNELIKRINTNETLLKRKQKATGIKSGYKSRYKEMRELLQRGINKHGKTEGQ